MLLTESQLNQKINEIYKEEQIKIIQERWKTLTGYEKRFIFEFVKEFKPEKAYLLNESKWYNTLGDIVGIFDPTGIVDIMNGLSYFKQGDNLFGALSIISAIPYVGDVAGKSVMGYVKMGGKFSKQLKNAKTAGELAKVGKEVPVFGKLLGMMGGVGNKVGKILEKVPGGKVFTKDANKWVGLLSDAGKLKTTTKAGELLVKPGFRSFRDFGLNNYTGLKRLWKKGGIFKNRQLSFFLQRTKFYLSFLDFLGLGNFVGPNELMEKMGEENFNKKMDQYMETDRAKKHWEDDMNKLQKDEEPKQVEKVTYEPEEKSTESSEPPKKTETEDKKDPINSILSTLIGVGLKL